MRKHSRNKFNDKRHRPKYTTPAMMNHELLLARFISRIGAHQDTPSLILIIAADTDYLLACRSIVDPTAKSVSIPESTLQRICRQHDWCLDDLREKLAPAAKALGILPPGKAATDYYQVLGVQEKATSHEIRQAFRNRAFHVHPDTASDPSDGKQQFQDLMDAYHTLRDPDLRDCYDAGRQRRRRWLESPARMVSADGRESIYLWYLGGLMLIFIVLLFFTIAINVS
jgi:DnaJ-domain-containing protein 1